MYGNQGSRLTRSSGKGGNGGALSNRCALLPLMNSDRTREIHLAR